MELVPSILGIFDFGAESVDMDADSFHVQWTFMSKSVLAAVEKNIVGSQVQHSGMATGHDVDE